MDLKWTLVEAVVLVPCPAWHLFDDVHVRARAMTPRLGLVIRADIDNAPLVMPSMIPRTPPLDAFSILPSRFPSSASTLIAWTRSFAIASFFAWSISRIVASKTA
mgnify:CR=1 FL=1